MDHHIDYFIWSVPLPLPGFFVPIYSVSHEEKHTRQLYKGILGLVELTLPLPRPQYKMSVCVLSRREMCRK